MRLNRCNAAAAQTVQLHTGLAELNNGLTRATTATARWRWNELLKEL
jgi:X-X-X-Leu-X-X-Gly heptad repeat protein